MVWALPVSLAATQGIVIYFLFLQVLRCFSSLRLPRFRVTAISCWVPPFGNLWIKAYLQLPKAYRCSSRPSSAPSAKAFTVRPLFLNHFLIIFNMIALFFVLYLHIDSVNFSVHYILLEIIIIVCVLIPRIEKLIRIFSFQ